MGLLARKRLLQGVLVHLVDHVVGGGPRDGVVLRVQLPLAARVRDLLDQNDDVHRQTNLRGGSWGRGRGPPRCRSSRLLPGNTHWAGRVRVTPLTALPDTTRRCG